MNEVGEGIRIGAVDTLEEAHAVLYELDADPDMQVAYQAACRAVGNRNATPEQVELAARVQNATCVNAAPFDRLAEVK